MRYQTNSQLSEHLFETQEGFLLCPGVAIARTGAQVYAADEVDPRVACGAETVVMLRDPEEVFAAEAMASFEGKPLTVEHPDGGDVNPSNWKKLAVGHVQNVRRGEGADADLLLADILVTDAEAIRLIREEGLRELSCGYDAENEVVRPGVGRQTHISGNHVALVPQGRAGARCRINDKDKTMKKKATWLDRLLGHPGVRKAMRDAEEELKKDEEQAAEEAGRQAPATDEGEAAGDPGMEKLMEKLEEISLMLRRLLEEEKDSVTDEEQQDEETAAEGEQTQDEEGTCDEEEAARTEEPARTADRALRRTADAATLRRAGILSPRGSFRAADSDVLVKRMALRDACRNGTIRRLVDAILNGRSLETCSPAVLSAAFIAASESMAAMNNRRTADTLVTSGRPNFGHGVTPAEINAANREFYSKRS